MPAHSTALLSHLPTLSTRAIPFLLLSNIVYI